MKVYLKSECLKFDSNDETSFQFNNIECLQKGKMVQLTYNMKYIVISGFQVHVYR